MRLQRNAIAAIVPGLSTSEVDHDLQQFIAAMVVSLNRLTNHCTMPVI